MRRVLFYVTFGLVLIGAVIGISELSFYLAVRFDTKKHQMEIDFLPRN